MFLNLSAGQRMQDSIMLAWLPLKSVLSTATSGSDVMSFRNKARSLAVSVFNLDCQETPSLGNQLVE
jgi:hypothetical protein